MLVSCSILVLTLSLLKLIEATNTVTLVYREVVDGEPSDYKTKIVVDGGDLTNNNHRSFLPRRKLLNIDDPQQSLQGQSNAELDDPVTTWIESSTGSIHGNIVALSDENVITDVTTTTDYLTTTNVTDTVTTSLTTRSITVLSNESFFRTASTPLSSFLTFVGIITALPTPVISRALSTSNITQNQATEQFSNLFVYSTETFSIASSNLSYSLFNRADAVIDEWKTTLIVAICALLVVFLN